MNTFILACLLCVVCSALGSLSSEITSPGGLSHVSGGTTPVDGLRNSLSEDDELDGDEELSGGAEPSTAAHELQPEREERRRRKGRSKHRRNKHKGRSSSVSSTTALNTAHSRGYTAATSSTVDPCTSTHLGYCIHGICQYMEGLQEPMCVCMKGFDGQRCGIQALESIRDRERSWTEVVQTVLVVMAVVLSTLSFLAVLLMACAHYRTHKTFMASYLGSGAEEEKLQKPIRDVMV